MGGHVSAESMMELAEGPGRAEEREHVLACGECRAQLDALRADLGTLAAVEVPEPAPIYWEAFRRQVGRRLEAEPPRRAWGWLWVPALAAAASVALWVRVPSAGGPGTGSAQNLPAWSALPSSDDDSGLSVLQALADGGQLSVASGCDELAACVEALSDADATALAAALRGEVGKGREL